MVALTLRQRAWTVVRNEGHRTALQFGDLTRATPQIAALIVANTICRQGYRDEKMKRCVPALIVAAGPFLGVSAAVFLFFSMRSDRIQIPAPVRIPVSPAVVIGPHADFRGDPHARYTLVEFGDYECPACRRAEMKVKSLLTGKGCSVRIIFRCGPGQVVTRLGAIWQFRDVVKQYEGPGSSL
jgi:hypothetical protein